MNEKKRSSAHLSPIVDNFRKGHEAIIAEVERIRPDVRDFSRSRQGLRDLDEKLCAHFKRQDEVFYKKLSDRFAQDREAIKMLEFLTYELKELQIKYFVFFDKYSQLVSSAAVRNFPKEFSEFADAVVSRIKMEEEYLLFLLEKFQPQNGNAE